MPGDTRGLPLSIPAVPGAVVPTETSPSPHARGIGFRHRGGMVLPGSFPRSRTQSDVRRSPWFTSGITLLSDQNFLGSPLADAERGVGFALFSSGTTLLSNRNILSGSRDILFLSQVGLHGFRAIHFYSFFVCGNGPYVKAP
jgi:hypothetical protein